MLTTKITRRRLLQTAMAATALSALHASLPGTTRAAPGVAQAKTTLTLWSPENRDADAEAHRWLIAEFEKAYPDLTVEITTTTWEGHVAKLQAAKAANTLPDLIYTWQTLQLATEGILQPIDDVWETVGKQNIAEFYHLAQKDKDGRFAGIPFFSVPHVLYYRSDWLAEKGLDVPRKWDTFKAAAAALTDPASQRFGVVLYSRGLDHYWLTDLMIGNDAHVFAEDKKTVVLNSPNTIEVLQLIKEINHNKWTPDGWTAWNMDDAKLPYLKGSIGMKIDSTSFADTINKDAPDLVANISVTPVPNNRGSKNAQAGASAYGMSATTRHRDEAKAFLEFMFKPEIYAGFLGREVLGFMPVYEPVGSDPAFYEQPRVKVVEGIYRGGAEAAKNGWELDFEYGPNVLLQKVYNAQIFSKMLGRIYQGESPAQVASWGAEEIKALVEESA